MRKDIYSFAIEEIDRMFDIDYTSVSVSVKRFEERMRRDKNMKGIVNRAIEGIGKGEE